MSEIIFCVMNNMGTLRFIVSIFYLIKIFICIAYYNVARLNVGTIV